MLKVLLVDDEPFIVQGLAVLIDWAGEGYEIAATAANGMEALSYLKENEVDLIIADIKMPVMTGIELLEKIRTKRISEAYFIILSGYNDFHYAQQAIRFDCMDYILKPIRREELTAVLRKIAGLHETSQKEKEESLEREKAYWDQNLIALLTGKHDQQNLVYIKERLHLSSGIRYVDIVIDEMEYTEDGGDEGEYTNKEKRQIQRLIYQNCLEYLGGDGDHCILDVSINEKGYDIGFVFCQHMAEEKNLNEQAFLKEFLFAIQKNTDAALTLFAGKKVADIAEIEKSYRTALMLKSLRTFRVGQDIYYYETENAKRKSEAVLCTEILDELIRAIEQNNKAKMNDNIDQLYGEMDKMEMVHLNFNYLIFQLIHLAVQLDSDVNQGEVLHRISSAAFAERNIPGSKEHMKRFAGDYAEYLSQLHKSGSGGILLNIEREVREHYGENLTLKEFSGKYYINSAYLGQIFRKKYGMAFKDYLNNYRMEQASLLLIRTDKRVYEVAEEVGFRDLDYFINRFITFKGCTPTKYRKQAREKKL